MPRNNQAGKPRAGRRDWRRLIQIALVALLAVDVLFFVLGFLPAGQTFAGQKADLEKLRDDLKVRQNTVAHLTKVEAALSDARQQGDEFYAGKFLPLATGYSQVMEEVEKLAKSASVRKGTVAYAAAEVRNRPDLIAVEITTSVEGEYGKIVQFVNQLEQSPLFLTVDSLGVSTGQTKLVRLALKLVTYFRVSGPVRAANPEFGVVAQR
jgi:Tfp pilus assembly protein PilO